MLPISKQSRHARCILGLLVFCQATLSYLLAYRAVTGMVWIYVWMSACPTSSNSIAVHRLISIGAFHCQSTGEEAGERLVAFIWAELGLNKQVARLSELWCLLSL